VLRGVLESLAADLGAARLNVLDVGGGTGGLAVPVAALGHIVTVVDPSPDALAALARRAAEAGVTERVTAVQGDIDTLPELVGAESVDAVLCHGALEMADDTVEACRNVARVLRPNGMASVLCANRAAVVLSQALGGRFTAARHVLDDPDGRMGPADPIPRRFTADALGDLLAGAGMRIESVVGVRVFADLVPGALLAGEPQAAAELAALEAAVAERPEFRAIAAKLHVVARRCQ
jgi:SAM-dependent methyltransferase